MVGRKSLKTVNDYYYHFLQNGNEDDEIIYFLKMSITLKDFEEYVDLFVKHLICLGVKKGDRIAYSMPSRPECYYVLLAASRIGASVLPLFHMIPDVIKTQIIINSNVSLMITINDMIKSLKSAVKKENGKFKIATIDGSSQSVYSFTKKPDEDINYEEFILKKTEEDLPLILTSTSGTIGVPKFVCMTQSNVANQIKIAGKFFGFIKQDRKIPVAMAFPLSTSGIMTCTGMLFANVFQIFSQEIGALKYLDLVYEKKAEYMAAPPAFYEAILNIKDDSERDYNFVKGIFTGMDFLQNSLIKRLKVKFENIDSFGNGYGLIETSNIIMTCEVFGKENIEDYPTNLMTLVEDFGNQIEVRNENQERVGIGEIGELYVKGKSVVKGYLGDSKGRNFVDGWIRTRDIVRFEAENKVLLLGRDKHLIKRNGKSISPIIVQKTVNEVPGVLTSCVVGVPYEIYGEMIWAFVVKKSDESVRLKDIMKYCRNNLVNYMVPDKVSFIDEIPKSGVAGKINFIKLKEIAKKELSEFKIGGI